MNARMNGVVAPSESRSGRTISGSAANVLIIEKR